MSDQTPGTIKYKKNKKQLNIGMIICIIIILYFVVYFCVFLFTKDVDYFEVVQGSTASNFNSQYSAFIIREESVVQSQASGYVNFFVGDEAPIYVGQQAYLIDKSGELSNMLKSAAQNQALLNENDLTEIKDSLYNFKISFTADNYYETYLFKYQIESQILDLINSAVFENYNNISGAYAVFDSEYAGIAMHYVDGFENCTVDSFDSSVFKKSSYRKDIIRANDFVDVGSNVFKVITSEDWSLVIQVEDPSVFDNIGSVVSINFLKDNITTTADFELIARGGNYYGILSLNKYMIHYATDRYTTISFTDTTDSGLKIPKSAAAKHTYYAIPAEYLTQGGNSSDFGFLVKTQDSDGNETAEIRYPKIVKQTDELCYISLNDSEIKSGDVLMKTDSQNEFQVGMTSDLDGVYIYNEGTSSFKFIEILGENDDYYIVSENTSNGLNLYDKIYADYKDAEKK